MEIIFYISAAVAMLATLMVVTRAHAVHALLYLIVSLLAVAMVFFTLGAPFVAALEVVVYGVKNGCEYVFDFDEYRELLTEEQLTEIRRMLELEAE